MPVLGQDQDLLMSLLQNNAAPRRTFGGGLQSVMQGLGGNDFALAMLANSGYSPNKQSFGQIVGNSALQARQMQTQRSEDDLMRRYREAQIGALDGKTNSPNSVREYEFAKQNGFKGSFQDWVVAGGQSSRPSSVQEWEFYNALPEDKKPLYLEMKRNPNFTVKDVNQVPTSIQQSIVGGVNTLPLSNLPQTAEAAETVKQAEGRGGAVGKIQGEISGGIQKKGSDAENVLGMTREARDLLKQSTGSVGGTLVDRSAGAVGISTGGARAGARLKVLQAGLMTNMPRMEGPQSDADVQLYREAAAQIGDTTVPVETRAAALDTIDYLQNKYKERAKTTGGKRRYNPDTGKIE